MAQVTLVKRSRVKRGEKPGSCRVRLLKKKTSSTLRYYRLNAIWISEHMDVLRADSRYRDRFVAIDDGAVIAYSKDLKRLLRSVKQRVSSDERSRVVIRHISSEPQASIL